MRSDILNYFNLIDLIKNQDSQKIGLYFSFSLHLFFLLFIIGLPNLFKPSPINIPVVIPIEIINVSEITSVNESTEEEKKEESSLEKIEKVNKFNNVQQEFDKKVQVEPEPKVKDEKIIETKEEVKFEKNNENTDVINEDIKVKIKEKIEALPTKKIKPKIKPKPVNVDNKKVLDIEVKIKDKPKPIFDIASMLKDLRNDKSLINNQELEKDSNKEKIENKKNDENSQAPLSISEIDLLIQQLSSCWSAPAGAVIEKGMVVKIAAKIKQDKRVLYETVRIVDTNISQNNPFYGPITESAMRTLLNPECNPLKLPDDKYDLWKSLTINFDHSIMKGY